VSTSRINLSWRDTSNNESGFRIERRIGTGTWSQIATVTGSQRHQLRQYRPEVAHHLRLSRAGLQRDRVKQDCLIEDGKIMARHLDNAMTCLVSIGARWAMSDYRADSLQAREAMCGFNPIHQAAALIDENGCKQVPVVSE
jgi:hypothetical protein